MFISTIFFLKNLFNTVNYFAFSLCKLCTRNLKGVQTNEITHKKDTNHERKKAKENYAKHVFNDLVKMNKQKKCGTQKLTTCDAKYQSIIVKKKLFLVQSLTINTNGNFTIWHIYIMCMG